MRSVVHDGACEVKRKKACACKFLAKRALGLDFEPIEGRVAALDSFPPFESLPAFDWDARPMMGVPASRPCSADAAPHDRLAIATMCGQSSIGDLDLLLRSVVLFEPEWRAVYLATDSIVRAWALQLKKRPRRLIPLLRLDGYPRGRAAMERAGLWQSFNLQKPQVMRHVLEQGHGGCLWVDADVFLVAPLPSVLDGPGSIDLGLSKQHINSNFEGMYGAYNSGYVLARSTAPLARQAGQKSHCVNRCVLRGAGVACRLFNSQELWEQLTLASNSSCCADQLALDMLTKSVPHFVELPRDQNVGWYQLSGTHNAAGRNVDASEFTCDTETRRIVWRAPNAPPLSLLSLHMHLGSPEGVIQLTHPRADYRTSALALKRITSALHDVLRRCGMHQLASFFVTDAFPYRLGDEFMLGSTRPVGSCINFPRSIACRYALSRAFGRDGDVSALTRSVEQYAHWRALTSKLGEAEKPPGRSLVIHVRLGDVATAKGCFKRASLCLLHGSTPYLEPRAFFAYVVKTLPVGVRNVVVVGSTQHIDPQVAEQYPGVNFENNSLDYLDSLTRFLHERNLSVSTRLNREADADVVYLCNARWLVCAGMSHFCTTMAYCALNSSHRTRVWLDSRIWLGNSATGSWHGNVLSPKSERRHRITMVNMTARSTRSSEAVSGIHGGKDVRRTPAHHRRA